MSLCLENDFVSASDAFFFETLKIEPDLSLCCLQLPTRRECVFVPRNVVAVCAASASLSRFCDLVSPASAACTGDLLAEHLPGDYVQLSITGFSFN